MINDGDNRKLSFKKSMKNKEIFLNDHSGNKSTLMPTQIYEYKWSFPVNLMKTRDCVLEYRWWRWKGKAGFKSFLPTSHSATPARNEKKNYFGNFNLRQHVATMANVDGVRWAGQIDEVKANGWEVKKLRNADGVPSMPHLSLLLYYAERQRREKSYSITSIC